MWQVAWHSALQKLSKGCRDALSKPSLREANWSCGSALRALLGKALEGKRSSPEPPDWGSKSANHDSAASTEGRSRESKKLQRTLEFLHIDYADPRRVSRKHRVSRVAHRLRRCPQRIKFVPRTAKVLSCFCPLTTPILAEGHPWHKSTTFLQRLIPAENPASGPCTSQIQFSVFAH